MALPLSTGLTTPEQVGHIAIVCAGTSDFRREARRRGKAFGNRVERHVDVGVAGIHRILGRAEALRSANGVVVVAGMEGALPSVVGGLVAVHDRSPIPWATARASEEWQPCSEC